MASLTSVLLPTGSGSSASFAASLASRMLTRAILASMSASSSLALMTLPLLAATKADWFRSVPTASWCSTASVALLSASDSFPNFQRTAASSFCISSVISVSFSCNSSCASSFNASPCNKAGLSLVRDWFSLACARLRSCSANCWSASNAASRRAVPTDCAAALSLNLPTSEASSATCASLAFLSASLAASASAASASSRASSACFFFSLVSASFSFASSAEDFALSGASSASSSSLIDVLNPRSCKRQVPSTSIDDPTAAANKINGKRILW
mmetsp:Transcript_7572/g.17889  ORF Transcript_7572/g.17889 Transcript_7572/m.17889 type:complete len:272 (-) Transcript_7572:82-897(-)